MLGDNPSTIYKNSIYQDAGATATDNIDDTVAVTITGKVNTSIVGTYTITYTITYTAIDNAGNIATALRTIKVLNTLFYVKQDATGTNNGTSWTNAYRDLQNALAVAQSGDEIWVSKGVYKPTSGSDRSIYFQLKNGVNLYGGFTGIETTRIQRDWKTNITILSGDLQGNDNNNIKRNEPTRSDNSYHVIISKGVNDSTILDGFTITAGNANFTTANYNYQDTQGGGDEKYRVFFSCSY